MLYHLIFGATDLFFLNINFQVSDIYWEKWVKLLVVFKWISLLLLWRNNLASLSRCLNLGVIACLGVSDTSWLVHYHYVCSSLMSVVKRRLRFFTIHVLGLPHDYWYSLFFPAVICNDSCFWSGLICKIMDHCLYSQYIKLQIDFSKLIFKRPSISRATYK